jgi:hypothetical protein
MIGSISSPAVAVAKEPPMSTAAAAKYKELRKKIADAKKTMEETAKGLFIDMATDLFNDNPDLVSFGWTQYTPYYNDGDVCTFRCHGDYPTVSMIVDGDVWSYDSNRGDLLVNGHEQESSDELVRKFQSLGVDEFKKGGKTYAYDKKTNTVTVDGKRVPTYEENDRVFDALEKKVGAFMRNFEAEDMLVMFGDHAQVTVTRDGNVEIEEYQHD